MHSSLIDSQQRVPEQKGIKQQPGGPDQFSGYSAAPPSMAYPPQHKVSPLMTAIRLCTPQEGWLAFVLLAIMLYCVVAVIVSAGWVHVGAFLYISPIVGLFIGLLVAKLPYMPQALLHLLACLLGHVLAIWITSTYAFHVPPSVVLGGLQVAFTGHMAEESLQTSEMVFFFYLSFLCFFLGYFGSWLIYRARLPWLVGLVYCSIMLVNLNYVLSNYNYLLLVMLGALVLLIARIELASRLVQWSSEGLYTDRDWLRKITARCMQVACLIMLLALPLGWLLPIQDQPASGKVFWDRINATWNAAVTGNLSWQTLHSITTSNSNTTNYFGNQLTISSSVHLPDGEVLFYTSSDQKSHYLESVAFNHFSDNTWTNSSNGFSGTQYPANMRLPQDIDQDPNDIVNTTVTMTQAINGSKNYVFAPAQPLQFNMPTQVYNSGGRGVSTMTAWTQLQPLSAKSKYSVTSALTPQNKITDVPLPQDNSAFWQADRYYYWLNVLYLEQPQNRSAKVEATTRAWTQGATNAYDALKRIESHLNDSRTFTYSVDNPAIPPGKDIADVLLDTHTGYCTYYASAMAIMGRVLNIPTRLVTGFSSGKYDATRKGWSVSGSDAHSWVQAYFPGNGWIDFDPTPGFSPQSQTAAKTALPTVTPTKVASVTPTPKAQPTKTAQQASQKQQSTPPPDHTDMLTSSVIWISLGILLCAIIFFVSTIVIKRRREYEVSVSRFFWRACRVAAWAGLGPKSWQTPYEYATMLSQHLERKEPALWHLTDLFVRERWGAPQQVPQEQDAVTIERTWPSLRSMLVRLFFLRKKK
ncbi:hypothetical protein KDW_26060 [Dictyobacter vulcani]|uniref:Transglutaminase-like domain-containing protein n=1 Tax=Dictyobacter vulcani TaxID=2607529 RepID=A0A5J4KG60_9CHLR|nr:transglutaminase domain-containing protein [Dictyobacter vulcani]GER88444.1 hypothetical protein KDW_26060 [Dictyobacter vulcani]